MEGIEALLSAEAVIRLPFPHQLLRIGQIEPLPLALHIGSIFAAYIRALVVAEAHLLQSVVNYLNGTLHLAFLICILNTQHKGTAHGFGDQIFV